MTGAGERRSKATLGAPTRRSADLGWLAGVVEGEGSLQLINRACPRLEVTNTDPTLLQRCREIGGRGKIRLCRQGYARRRDCYRWYVSGADARYVIRLIRPYLVIKGEQADIVLSVVVQPGRRLTDAQRADRRAKDYRLRELKRLSYPPPSP